MREAGHHVRRFQFVPTILRCALPWLTLMNQNGVDLSFSNVSCLTCIARTRLSPACESDIPFRQRHLRLSVRAAAAGWRRT